MVHAEAARPGPGRRPPNYGPAAPRITPLYACLVALGCAHGAGSRPTGDLVEWDHPHPPIACDRKGAMLLDAGRTIRVDRRGAASLFGGSDRLIQSHPLLVYRSDTDTIESYRASGRLVTEFVLGERPQGWFGGDFYSMSPSGRFVLEGEHAKASLLHERGESPVKVPVREGEGAVWVGDERLWTTHFGSLVALDLTTLERSDPATPVSSVDGLAALGPGTMLVGRHTQLYVYATSDGRRLSEMTLSDVPVGGGWSRTGYVFILPSEVVVYVSRAGAAYRVDLPVDAEVWNTCRLGRSRWKVFYEGPDGLAWKVVRAPEEPWDLDPGHSGSPP